MTLSPCSSSNLTIETGCICFLSSQSSITPLVINFYEDKPAIPGWQRRFRQDVSSKIESAKVFSDLTKQTAYQSVRNVFDPKGRVPRVVILSRDNTYETTFYDPDGTIDQETYSIQEFQTRPILEIPLDPGTYNVQIIASMTKKKARGSQPIDPFELDSIVIKSGQVQIIEIP